MNYFGLFFTFMVPGIVIGSLAAFGAREAARPKQKRGRRNGSGQMRTVPRNKLYICSLDNDTKAA